MGEPSGDWKKSKNRKTTIQLPRSVNGGEVKGEFDTSTHHPIKQPVSGLQPCHRRIFIREIRRPLAVNETS
jgi:hypothetical protein